MTGRVPLLLALLMLAGPAWADHAAECRVAEQLVERDYPLQHVASALAAKQLNILVVGAGSSLLPGQHGAENAYPARLQSALAEKLPGLAVQVTTDVQARRTAHEMVKTLGPALGDVQAGLDDLADRHRGRHAVNRYRSIQRIARSWHTHCPFRRR